MSVSAIGSTQAYSPARINQPTAQSAGTTGATQAATAGSTDSDGDHPFSTAMKTDLSGLSQAAGVDSDGDNDGS